MLSRLQPGEVPMKMRGTKFHARSIAAAQAEAKQLREVLNEYEAAKRYSKDRTYLPGYVQDAKDDISECTRMELVRKSRWFEKNDPFANRLAEVFVEFTAGAYGPQMTPASSDDEWNQRAADWIAEWCPNADITSRLGYAGLITTAVWRRFFDGEFFILKTFGENRSRPRLQGISAHRVATPPEMADREGKTIIDGVEIDSRGRPVAYWIQEGVEADKFTRRTAQEVIHLFEPESPGQYRGIPMLTPVMTVLHDFNDLFLFEMRAAKDAAEKSTIITNATGQLDISKLRREVISGNAGAASSTNPDDWKERTQFFQRVVGGRTIAMKQGEDIKQFMSNRPTVSQQWMFDYLASRICAGIGFSKLLVFPWSIQGTVARADLELARNFFLCRFAPVQSVVQEIYRFVIGVARFTDARIADAPSDWARVNIRPPRTVNVDVGRNAQAIRSDLETGQTTYDEQYAMRGYDWREQLRQKAREAAFIRQLAAEFKVDPSEISMIQVDRPERISTEPKEPESIDDEEDVIES
jgi:capsid protein